LVDKRFEVLEPRLAAFGRVRSNRRLAGSGFAGDAVVVKDLRHAVGHYRPCGVLRFRARKALFLIHAQIVIAAEPETELDAFACQCANEGVVAFGTQ
jgi:hypothetical protein